MRWIAAVYVKTWSEVTNKSREYTLIKRNDRTGFSFWAHLWCQSENHILMHEHWPCTTTITACKNTHFLRQISPPPLQLYNYNQLMRKIIRAHERKSKQGGNKWHDESGPPDQRQSDLWIGHWDVEEKSRTSFDHLNTQVPHAKSYISRYEMCFGPSDIWRRFCDSQTPLCRRVRNSDSRGACVRCVIRFTMDDGRPRRVGCTTTTVDFPAPPSFTISTNSAQTMCYVLCKLLYNVFPFSGLLIQSRGLETASTRDPEPVQSSIIVNPGDRVCSDHQMIVKEPVSTVSCQEAGLPECPYTNVKIQNIFTIEQKELAESINKKKQ